MLPIAVASGWCRHRQDPWWSMITWGTTNCRRSTTTTTRSHVFFGRLEEDCQIFPPNNFWQWWCSPQLSYCLQFHVFLVRDTTHQQRCSHVLRCRTSAPPCCPCNLSFKSVGHSFQSTQNQFVYQVVPSDDYHLTEKGKTANNQQPTNNHQQPTP